MIREIYTAALGMTVQQTKLETTANNIANANTTGFKKIGVFEREVIKAGQNLNNVKENVEQEDAPLTHWTDFSKGDLQRTGNDFDIAIDGKGFFLVQDDNGMEYLTRKGHFTLGSDGRLMTYDGHSVVAEGGALFVRDNLLRDNHMIDDENPIEFRVRENGDVFVNENLVGRLTLVNVDNPQSLKRETNALFRPTETTIMEGAPEDQVRVRQGYVEGSNVNIVNEMVQMIQLQRNFEMGQKIISTNDATLDRSIDIARIM